MRYYYPNRPLIQPPEFLEDENLQDEYWAEPKYNGDRLELRKIEGKWEFWGRHKNKITRFSPPPEMVEESEALDVPDDTHLDGELMHFRTKKVKNLVVIYDVYVIGGKRVRDSLTDRRKYLEELIPKTNKHIVLIEKIEGDFKQEYEKLIKQDHIEGLVLKRADGRIKFNAQKSNDVNWQIKVRRPHANYKF
jgi:ATP-dependent DNA ligase